MQSAATHEIGHVLGLDHSTTESGAIMWPYIEHGELRRTLHQDDIDGIRYLYMARAPAVQERRPADAAAGIRFADLKPKFHGTQGPNSWVVRQGPKAGTYVEKESQVDLELENGPIR